MIGPGKGGKVHARAKRCSAHRLDMVGHVRRTKWNPISMPITNNLTHYFIYLLIANVILPISCVISNYM